MLRKFTVALAFALSATAGAAQAQTVTPLAHSAPEGVDVMFQLTDGSVLVQADSNNMDFYKLTPDNKGSYVNGTWTKMASLPSGYSPYAAASAVFADGRAAIIGGEYNFGNFTLTNQSEVYDPVANKWTALAPPKGWKNIGDSPLSVMPDGSVLLGEKLNKKMAVLNPTTLTWSKVKPKGKSDFNAEEGWTLLPNGTVLTLDVKNGPNTEIYTPSAKTPWQSAGHTPQMLAGPPCCSCINYGGKKPYCPPGEIGPALLMPDGSVFATGSMPKGENTAHTAVYANGTWTSGPDFPNGDEAGDSFAALLPNGHALVEGISGELYEFDGTHLTAEPFNGGGNALMVLPSGEILVGGSEVYKSTGTYNTAWAPTITTAPSSVTRGSSYQISGTQFNGLSQANAFGDEFEMATNYPLVRITNNATGHVFYARTHDHSTMAVATGTATVSTNFDVPSGMETGASSLVVVANGIPSVPVSVTVN